MIPISQIVIKSSPGGEFEFVANGAEFIGYYMETSDGLYFAGTNNIIPGPQLFPIIEGTAKNPNPTINVKKFNLLKNDLKQFLAKTTIVPTMKQHPTDRDYKNSYYTRYFAKRIQNTAFIEIEKSVYDSIYKRDGKYDHNLYEVGNIIWHLKGNVFQKNAIEIERKEAIHPNISYLFPLFNEFHMPDLQNQENLYTEGGELYYADGNEYIGYYHIHTTEGPMEGAYHTDVPHLRLYYTNQLPTPQNMTYENWLDQQDNDIIGTYPPNRGETPITPTGGGESYNCVTTWGPPEDGYTGMVNSSGQVPTAFNCLDPGDGTGLYRASTWVNPYAACITNCNVEFLVDIGQWNIGCLLPFDLNYCGPPAGDCEVMDLGSCHLTYWAYPHGQLASTYDIFEEIQAETICSCGSYNQMSYYHYACCATDEVDTSSSGTGGTGGSSSGGGGSSCFISDTLITMADSTEKLISSIKIGDKVKSEIGESTVLDIQIHKGNFEVYSFNNKKAFTTAEHPFKTIEGWKAINPITTLEKHKVESKTLKLGDTILKINGNETIETIEKGETTYKTVYNLILDNEHVYYADGYLVHNTKEDDVRDTGDGDDTGSGAT